MKRSHSHVNAFFAQGLVEYSILIALVALIAIFGLYIFGGSISGGLIKVCAALGIDSCQSATTEVAPPVLDSTPTVAAVTSSPVIPTATQRLSEPEPTRGPAVVFTSIPAKVVELKSLRIKVNVSGKGKADGILVVAYNAAGEYAAEAITDDKGNATLPVADGNYTVSTYYDGVWQKDGPFAPGSKENVIHR